ncbi:MAG TPA: helix-turn-helix domain-containing protein [Mycobacteriales bacterium]|nr:helix-turn-helix domain-containing protein [Mycobacteriales bacterium]
MTRERRRRADAERSRQLLLDAAGAVFATEGVSAPLDRIAREAGIGNATLYRHFPTRQDLIVAVYSDEVQALCERGAQLSSASSPAAALFRWLRLFIDHVAGKRELALAVPEGRQSELFDGWHSAMHDTAKNLLSRAQRAGQIRTSITVLDLLTLANGIALATRDEEQIGRLLRTVRRGIAG